MRLRPACPRAAAWAAWTSDPAPRRNHEMQNPGIAAGVFVLRMQAYRRRRGYDDGCFCSKAEITWQARVTNRIGNDGALVAGGDRDLTPGWLDAGLGTNGSVAFENTAERG